MSEGSVAPRTLNDRDRLLQGDREPEQADDLRGVPPEPCVVAAEDGRAP
jgi:hypothetical protein